MHKTHLKVNLSELFICIISLRLQGSSLIRGTSHQIEWFIEVIEILDKQRKGK